MAKYALWSPSREKLCCSGLLGASRSLVWISVLWLYWSFRVGRFRPLRISSDKVYMAVHTGNPDWLY